MPISARTSAPAHRHAKSAGLCQTPDVSVQDPGSTKPDGAAILMPSLLTGQGPVKRNGLRSRPPQARDPKPMNPGVHLSTAVATRGFTLLRQAESVGWGFGAGTGSRVHKTRTTTHDRMQSVKY